MRRYINSYEHLFIKVFLPSGVSTVVSGSLTDPNGQLSDPALASISQVIYSQSQVLAIFISY